MSVVQPRVTGPLSQIGPSQVIERVPRVPQSGEIWQIRVERTPPSSRESTSKISQLENSIQFLTKQHNDVLKSLQSEIESLKLKNKELQFSNLVSGGGVDSSLAKSSSNSLAPIVGNSANENRHIKALQDEVDALKTTLINEREHSKKLHKQLDSFKRSIPMSNGKSMRPGSSSSISSPREGAISTTESSSKFFVEEALPFSLKPFVVHIADAPDRAPTLQECQAIIAQLSFHCQHLQLELTEVKDGLKDVLHSQKWTPDAFLMAKAIINEPAFDERPGSSDSKSKSGKSQGKAIKIPESSYMHKDHGSLPALRQTLVPGVIERQKKVTSMHKRKQKSYTIASHMNDHGLLPQPPNLPRESHGGQ